MLHKQDAVQRFLLEEISVSGKIAHLQQAYQTIVAQRPYPPMLQRLLGEALVAAALLAAHLKFTGAYSLQFEGDRRLSLLLVQCDEQLGLRGLAKYQPNLTDQEYAEAFLTGQMILTAHSAQNPTHNYQSKLPIDSLSIANNLMNYFEQSEQLNSFMFIATNETTAAGFFLQQLPSPGAPVDTRQEHWDYATHIGKTITAAELLTLDNETLLHRLYHETAVRLFDAKPVEFRCRCTPERLHRALKVLGYKECVAILSTHKTVEACCEFCNKAYHFDAAEIERVFEEGKA